MSRLVNLLALLVALFTRLGPAPEKPSKGKEDPSEESPDDEGLPADTDFYAEDPDDPDQDTKKPQEKPKAKAKPKDDDEEDLDDDDDPDDEGEDDDDDSDDDDDDSEEEDEPTARALALDTRWETELSARHGRGEGQVATPNLGLDKMGLREQARARFAAIRDKDEDGKQDAEAIFEIALDAAVQVLSGYHFDHAAPQTETMNKALRNTQVAAKLGKFTDEMGDAMTEAVERRMAALYVKKAEAHGWRLADVVPFKDLFEMAGGRLPKKGKARKTAKAKAKQKAQRQKARDLGATHTPRRVTGGRPRQSKRLTEDEKREQTSSRAVARSMEPFFTM